MEKSRFNFEVSTDHNKLIVANLLTFKLVKLDEKCGGIWKSGSLDTLPKGILTELFENGFLCDKEISDDQRLEKAWMFFGKKKREDPTHTIFITDSCNMCCPYCFERAIDFKHAIFNKQMVDAAVETIRKCGGERSLKRILIFGGEPLMQENEEVLVYLLEKLSQFKHRYVEVVTNGMEFQNMFQVISKYQDVISSFRFTLNGSREVHNQIRDTKRYKDTYMIIINAIKRVLHDLKLRVDINVLLDNQNIMSIPDLLQDLKAQQILTNPKAFVGFGRTQFALNPDGENYKPEILLCEYYKELIKLYESIPKEQINVLQGGELPIVLAFIKHILQYDSNNMLVPNLVTCRATQPGRYCYYPDGSIYPCTEVTGIKEYAIGTFFPKLDFNDEKKKWSTYVFPDKCLNCSFICICNGGCPVSNISMNNDIKEVYCFNVAETIRNALVALDEGGFIDEGIIY